MEIQKVASHEQHAWLGFATSTILPIWKSADLGVMRTVIDAREANACLGQDRL